MTNGLLARRDDTMAETAPAPDPAAVAALAAEAAELARRHQRDDLADRLDRIGERVARTETVVCVVGEFKKGKSALINALLAEPVCPVDDDLATTTVTVVRYSPEPMALVRRREDGRLVVEDIAPMEIADWAVEADGAERLRGVEVVEVGLPIAFLEHGLALVDTPGVGGLNAAHAAATLAFLPSADALVFVTDASAELSAPEIAFLGAARAAGPPILVVVTKVDIHPAWRRIVELDTGHLQTAGLAAVPFPLSSVLRLAGRDRGDRELEAESGVPVFAEALVEDAVGRARATAAASAIAAVTPLLDQLREPPATELAALDRPEAVEALTTDLATTRARLATLTDADASWSVRLEDEFAALRTRTEFAFQARMRQVLREAQDEVERIDPARSWAEVGQRVQTDTAAAVQSAFGAATAGAVAIEREIATLLADEAVGLDGGGTVVSFDVAALWQEGGPTFEGRTRSNLIAGLGLAGGATVGVEMLGMVGTLLGAAVVGPAVLGVAAVFGGKQVLDERRRLLAERRQQARSFLGSFMEEVRFEADGRLASLLDEIQRQMRARFADRIRELRRTLADTAAALERASEQAQSERRDRRALVLGELAEIDALRERAAVIGAASG